DFHEHAVQTCVLPITNRRVMRFKGLLSVDVAERRLAQIGQIKLHIPRYGHALRLGSILMQLAEHDSTPLWWDDVARPHEIHEIQTGRASCRDRRVVSI